MMHEVLTSLSPEEVVQRAKGFFTTRVPATGAFVETESSRHLVLRGQGGEEIVIAATPHADGSSVRGSTMMFDQQVRRFFTTLPEVADSGLAHGGPAG